MRRGAECHGERSRELRMDMQEAIAKTQDAITVNRVFGEPI
jgi:hypothetical protein